MERYPGENEVDHDSQDTVQPCTYPALYAILSYSGRVRRRRGKMPPTRPAPAISFFLIAEFRFLLCTLENNK